MEGGIATADGTDAPAAVEFSDQSADGTAVTVDSVRMDDGGFVTIHDSSLLDGDPLGSVRGVSAYLDPGSYEGLDVELADPLAEDDALIAMPHRDTNDNEVYDFVESGGEADGPYVDENGDAVVGDAVEGYTDDEGVVQTAGLRHAIGDWRAGNIDTGLLRDVIRAWRSGNPV
ncbi:MAG: hypothetical protein V5A55_07535 [Halovenus sp.]